MSSAGQHAASSVSELAANGSAEGLSSGPSTSSGLERRLLALLHHASLVDVVALGQPRLDLLAEALDAETGLRQGVGEYGLDARTIGGVDEGLEQRLASTLVLELGQRGGGDDANLVGRVLEEGQQRRRDPLVLELRPGC
ncbi:MAG: hypothetical protein QM765_04255 [Myxococcales bacterium]